MAAVINTNIASLNTQRNLGTSQSQLNTSIQRLSSGLRINSAKDDAAGLAISERMSAQVRGLNVAARNANDGVSLAQTAEGALGKVGDMLQRVRELAIQSANATNSQSDRDALQAEVTQLKGEIDRVATTTKFNGTALLDGTFTAQNFQVGANSGETITLASIANAKTSALGTWTSAVTNVATATTSVAPGTFSTATSQIVGQEFKLTVGGVDIIHRLDTGTDIPIDAALLDTELGTKAGALTTAGISYTGSFQAGNIVFSKADGSDFSVDLINTFDETGFWGTQGGFANAGFVATHTNGTAQGGGTPQTGFASLDISSATGAQNAILAMDAALDTVNNARGTLGAMQSRFESAVSNIQIQSENLSAARSRIVDADFAAETAALTRGQILQQAGTAMLAQANSLPNNVLSLLR